MSDLIWVIHTPTAFNLLLSRYAACPHIGDTMVVLSGAEVGGKIRPLDTAYLAQSAALVKSTWAGISFVAITGSDSIKIPTMIEALKADPNVDYLGFQYTAPEPVYYPNAQGTLTYICAQSQLIRASGKPFFLFITGREVIVHDADWDYGAISLCADEMLAVMHWHCKYNRLQEALDIVDSQLTAAGSTTPWSPQINIGPRIHNGVTSAQALGCLAVAKSYGKRIGVGWDTNATQLIYMDEFLRGLRGCV